MLFMEAGAVAVLFGWIWLLERPFGVLGQWFWPPELSPMPGLARIVAAGSELLILLVLGAMLLRLQAFVSSSRLRTAA